MTRQLDLGLRHPAHRRRVGPELARRMLAILHARGGWVTRAEFKAHGLNPRQCRLGRECSHGRIIFGAQGYRLLETATAEEVHACLGYWQAQIKAAQREHAQLCRRAHRMLNEGKAK